MVKYHPSLNTLISMEQWGGVRNIYEILNYGVEIFNMVSLANAFITFLCIPTYAENKSCIDTEEKCTNGKASPQRKKRCLGKLTKE